jgi:DNA-binding response OmpR family regulator
VNTAGNTVLVVDDNSANLKVLLALFQDHGLRVRVAKSGERALASCLDELPDLILLDILMPGVDGFETCRRLKAQASTADIPVIFMTSLTSIEDKLAAFSAGGVDYIPKPFQDVEVLARVNTHLTLRRRELQLKQALAEVETLSGILPICSFCRNIRDDDGYWQRVEEYISKRTDAQFSHSFCPTCMKEHYPDVV